MTVHQSVLELIGRTPMVRTQRLDTGPCQLFLKLESANPGGSIKDRIGLSMIEGAEKDGRIRPGDILVEGTAGNTGLGLALVAQAKGYRLILVVPDKMSREKIFINQFGNPDNPAAHIATTGPEILEQMDGQIDAIVLGCGSSGTLSGLSKFFAEHSPQTELVLADPVGSILAEYINEGTLSTKSASWMVEGIGEDFLPGISDFTRVKKAYAIPDKESFLTARELLAKEGVLGGSSTGTLLAAALRYCREQTTSKRVVTLVCDTGNKYLSKLYNDYWMLDNGFIERLQPHEAVRRVAAAGDGRPQAGGHRRRVGRADARARRRVAFPRFGVECHDHQPAETRRALAGRVAAAGVRARPCGHRGRRRRLPRPDHPHRPAELVASQGELMTRPATCPKGCSQVAHA